MLKRPVASGEIVVCKISNKVVSAIVVKGGSKSIKVRNMMTNRVCTLKSLRAIRSVTMKVASEILDKLS